MSAAAVLVLALSPGAGGAPAVAASVVPACSKQGELHACSPTAGNLVPAPWCRASLQARRPGGGCGGPPVSSDSSSTTCAPVLVQLNEVYYSCSLGVGASSVDLSNLPGVPALASSTPITIQAWGGAGGSVAINGVGVSGGASGFAQTVTSLGSLQSGYGTTTIHYYLGEQGNHFTGPNSWTAASGGGSSTIVSTVDASTTPLSTSENVLALAGAGGGGAIGCGIPDSCGAAALEVASGGAGGIAMSNPGGAHAAAGDGAVPGYTGGGGGATGVGGAFVPVLDGQNGLDGNDGIGGVGGGAAGTYSGVLWRNASPGAALFGPGGGAYGQCVTYQSQQFCLSGGGGGGWGGGASGSNGNGDQFDPSGGGGGGSFAAPSTASDDFAPTTARDHRFGQVGGVQVLVQVQSLPYQSAFCSQTTLAGTEGFRCIVPFDWTFTAPSGYLQSNWLVTMQAVGGPGGNGGAGGQAQTTLNATDLVGKTLYAYVGAAGAESTTNGGGGGGATVLATSPSVWSGASSGVLGPNVLLVAGGGGGGYAFGSCSGGGSAAGAGGVAIASTSVAATGNGGNGSGQNDPGKGATFSGTWHGGSAGGSGAGSGSSWMTFVGGIGGAASSSSAAATLASIGGSTPTQSGVGTGGAGAPSGCNAGGGGAGAAAGGGGGSWSTGGGGGSYAVGSDVEPTSLPSWAGSWLSLADQTQGQVSLFFYQGSQEPPAVPSNGAKVSTLQPTLGLTAKASSPPFSYVLTDTTVSTAALSASISSPPTSTSLWSIPDAGTLTPGHTYSWSVVDSTGATIQPPQTFTVDQSVPPGTHGVVMNMRSFLGTPPLPSNAPAYLQPQPGQKVAAASETSHDNDYTIALQNPDDFDSYFTTATGAQGITNPGAVNMDWVRFDPYGLGLAQIFTLQITGALTVPISGNYTFGFEAFGGARLTLKDASGNVLGGDPMIDSWGMIDGACNATFSSKDSISFVAAYATCVNTNGVVAAKSPVALVAGETYTFEIDGFMSWLPGPFRLLFSSNIFGADMTPVPGQWLYTNCTNCLGTPPGKALSPGPPR